MDENGISLSEQKVFLSGSLLVTTIDKFVSFLITSSLFLAIIAFLITYFSFLLYNISIDLSLPLAAFFLTLTIYNLNKLTDIKEDSINLPKRAEFIQENKNFVIYIAIFSYVVALLLAFLCNPFALFLILLPLCTGVLYSIKISNFRLKDITGIKNFIIALSCSSTFTFLPLAVSFRNLAIIMLVFYFIFVKILANSVLFDVRDIEGDRISGVRTIPVVFGKHKTKNLLLILNSTLIPWLAFSYRSGFFHQYLIVLIFAIAYGYWYILHFCKDEIKIGKSLDLFVDGEFIPIVMLATVYALL
jgi:4-hydroxybenzoate polyprenyltransferase